MRSWPRTSTCSLNKQDPLLKHTTWFAECESRVATTRFPDHPLLNLEKGFKNKTEKSKGKGRLRTRDRLTVRARARTVGATTPAGGRGPENRKGPLPRNEGGKVVAHLCERNTMIRWTVVGRSRHNGSVEVQTDHWEEYNLQRHVFCVETNTHEETLKLSHATKRDTGTESSSTTVRYTRVAR